MNTSNVRWPNSLWAAATAPGPDLPELIGTQQADVIVIGGGFTGLSTALHLREAGVDVAIVEAMEPGWYFRIEAPPRSPIDSFYAKSRFNLGQYI